MDLVARRGPLARAPGALKSDKAEKLKGGTDPLRFFNIHSVAKHEKIEENFFSGKNLTMPKKLKGGTLWDFPTSILSQNIKKMQGGPFEGKNSEKKFRKKMSRSAEKN